jgi:glycosyltransferase involved in cell wall biosynthesis
VAAPARRAHGLKFGERRHVKILILSWYFPPAGGMGSLRVGKLAKHLLAAGHDVRVICGNAEPETGSLPMEVPGNRVTTTSWYNINAFPRYVQNLRKKLKGDAPASAAGAPASAEAPFVGGGGGLLRKLGHLYQYAFNIPDSRIGWTPHALRAAGRVLTGWKPDLIYASAPPHTVFVVAERLSRRLGVPWIAEYRDRWSEDPYDDPPLPSWRGRIDRWLEDRLLRNAAGIVTVSEPWAVDYRARWGKRVCVAYNGYDAADFAALGAPAPSRGAELDIVYTGILYPNRRDPSPLLAALASMGAEAESIRVHFYGADPALLHPSIERYGVGRLVQVHGRVGYGQSLRLQAQADVLLLLQWNDPRERGNCPGKLFEYLAARRPILVLGYPQGVPATLIGERHAGVVANEPAEIAAALRRWLREKKTRGVIDTLPASTAAGLSRGEQYARLEKFMMDTVAPRAPAPVRRELQPAGGD